METGRSKPGREMLLRVLGQLKVPFREQNRLALAAGGTGIAAATGGDDSHPITGKALDEASAAALKATGGGTVTETEVGDGSR